MSSTNKNSVITHEVYQTPIKVATSLIQQVIFKKHDLFLEPCKADGNIFEQVPDCVSKKWAEIREGVDYLDTDFNSNFNVIITNPPFSMAEEFLRKSHFEIEDEGFIAYLLRLNFMGSLKRQPLWRDLGYPDKVVVLTPRPNFMQGVKGKYGDSCEYAWFIWDKGDSTMNWHDNTSLLI